MMSETETTKTPGVHSTQELFDVETYPLDQPGSDAYQKLLAMAVEGAEYRQLRAVGQFHPTRDPGRDAGRGRCVGARSGVS